ncbi:hypothetical protein N7510_007906 [Penicillium lagena]|uniref:uncharacterized protein n=1 Tax=Penicillium lagena TaxID=94218 RepID=UPI002540E358|nr:uncharacterized protein N7510_007906 [Penicillium lagena]KAJ5611187.1 hypothetical protein N7510_007906 [Penicillium lagena]
MLPPPNHGGSNPGAMWIPYRPQELAGCPCVSIRFRYAASSKTLAHQRVAIGPSMLKPVSRLHLAAPYRYRHAPSVERGG